MRFEDIALDTDKLARSLASFCFAARAEIIPHFKTPLAIEGKSDNSPVTIADKAAEASIRKLIAECYPEHNILGEEHGGKVTGTIDWVMDPIDGTRAFITGKPTFGSLIALCVGGVPVASAIDMPMLDEMFIAVPHRQTTCNEAQVRTSSVTDLAQARISSTAPEALDPQALEKYQALSAQCLTYYWGGDCYNYALLASGHLEIVIEHQLASHDVMALVPVIEQAGGIITDWQGGPVRLGKTDAVIACANKTLHKLVLEAMSS